LPAADDLPEPLRTSVDTAAPGHAGRKRGDVQFRRMSVRHAGSSAWVHDLPFVTRLNRPKLFEDVEVLDRLRKATWSFVPDSPSGPKRSATDLGVLTVRPDRKTKHLDGTAYEPVTVRVVASRYPRTGAANRGRVIHGWQVEVFAVDLAAEAWPAPDVVAQFFGRATQENRFAQEDRELGLDRIVSYHLPGQELATLVGLSLWNLRLARGFELEPPPEVHPVQQLRRQVRDDRAPASWPRDPVLGTLLAELDWPGMLAKRPGWAFDAETRELRCEEGRVLTLTTV